MSVAPASTLLNALSGILPKNVNSAVTGQSPNPHTATEAARLAAFEPASEVTFDPTAPIPEGPYRRGMIVNIVA